MPPRRKTTSSYSQRRGRVTRSEDNAVDIAPRHPTAPTTGRNRDAGPSPSPTLTTRHPSNEYDVEAMMSPVLSDAHTMSSLSSSAGSETGTTGLRRNGRSASLRRDLHYPDDSTMMFSTDVGATTDAGSFSEFITDAAGSETSGDAFDQDNEIQKLMLHLKVERERKKKERVVTLRTQCAAKFKSCSERQNSQIAGLRRRIKAKMQRVEDRRVKGTTALDVERRAWETKLNEIRAGLMSFTELVDAYQRDTEKSVADATVKDNAEMERLKADMAELDRDFQKWRATKKRNELLTKKIACFLDAL